MILASHPLMLLQHYGLPVIVALNRFGSDTKREFKMIRKHLGEQGVELLVCELRERLEGRDEPANKRCRAKATPQSAS